MVTKDFYRQHKIARKLALKTEHIMGVSFCVPFFDDMQAPEFYKKTDPLPIVGWDDVGPVFKVPHIDRRCFRWDELLTEKEMAERM